MVETSYASNNHEQAGVLAALMEDILYNHLIIGDIHAPMNKISDIYKITMDNKIIGGWSVFHGFNLPTVVLPPTIPEAWNIIRSMIKMLNINEFYAPFPDFMNEQVFNPPWSTWEEYNVKKDFTDIAMQLGTKDIQVMDISELPKIRGASTSDADEIKSYFEEVAKYEKVEGFFHPIQLETEMFVVAEDEGKIIAVGGVHFETPRTIQLGNIHVKNEYRRKGLGRAITTALCLGSIKSQRLPTLFVGKHNTRAINLYKSIGFQKFNEFSFYKLTLKNNI
ncbi:MAG: GNAT family N-acetyltransferase [Candidatus Heimdallarchaeota archaeon]|nr:GNAT family N-acetyltransferase [Candidatus Heimdallarchaeota archaeon]